MADPLDFYQKYNGKGVQNDYGIQCVAGWSRAFLPYLGLSNIYMRGNGDKQGDSAHQQHYSSHFIVIKNVAQLQTGDWYTCRYPSGTGHIAMYYGGDSFGQNQTSLGNPSNQQHPSAKFKCSPFKGSSWERTFICAYRYKGWADANYVATPSDSTDVDATASTSDGASITAPSISVDISKISPYVVTLHRDSPDKIDWNRLKANKVIGVLVEGGSYYSSSHSVVDFRNPKITAQIDAAVKAKLPYGIYMTARAKSVEEAKKEMYEFSFLVRKFPPGLGAWMKLDLSTSRALNDKIVKRYQQELEWLGLKYKVGFLATEPQILKQITWADFKDDWYLWVDRHVSSISELDKLLDPTFFDIPYTGTASVATAATVSAVAGVASTTISNTTFTGDTEAVIQTIFNFFKGKGFNTAICCGWLGNIQQESSFKVNAKQPGVGAIGIVQWDDRRYKMAAAVPNWETNLQGQLEYIWAELQSTERRSYRSLTSGIPNTLAGAKQACYIICTQYERAGSARMDKRYQYTEAFWNRFSNA